MQNPSLEQVIGQNVAKHRKRREWNQTELGAFMEQQLGKPWQRQRVWAVENGKSTFGAADLCALAAVLDVTVSDLFTAQEPVHVGDVLWTAERLAEAVEGVPDEIEQRLKDVAEILGAAEDVRTEIQTRLMQQMLILGDAEVRLRGLPLASGPQGTEDPNAIDWYVQDTLAKARARYGKPVKGESKDLNDALEEMVEEEGNGE